jgi:hypothetical protein
MKGTKEIEKGWIRDKNGKKIIPVEFEQVISACNK